MLMNLNTLNQMFKENPDKAQLSFKDCCQTCGHVFTIEIHNQSSGVRALSDDIICEHDRLNRRLGIERRQLSYTVYIPERRSGQDRRSH